MVSVPDADAQDLRTVLEAIYDGVLEVRPYLWTGHAPAVPGARRAAWKVERRCLPLSSRVQVGPDNLERLLRLASFLEVKPVLAACCDFMRQALTTHNAVPLLVLASRYGLLQLRAELVRAATLPPPHVVCMLWRCAQHAHRAHLCSCDGTWP